MKSTRGGRSRRPATHSPPSRESTSCDPDTPRIGRRRRHCSCRPLGIRTNRLASTARPTAEAFDQPAVRQHSPAPTRIRSSSGSARSRIDRSPRPPALTRTEPMHCHATSGRPTRIGLGRDGTGTDDRGENRIRHRGDRRRRRRAGRRRRRRSARREGRARREAQDGRRLPVVRLRAVEDADQVGARRARRCATPTAGRSRPRDPQLDLARVMERVAASSRGIEPNDSPERFRGLGVDVIFGDGRFAAPDALRGRRPPPHREDVRHRDRLAARGAADPRPRRRRRFSPTRRCSTCASRSRACSSSAAGRSAARWRRRSAGWAARSRVVDIAPRILPREDADLADVVQRQLPTEGVRVQARHVDREGRGHARRRSRLHARRRRTAPSSVVAGTHLLVAAGRTANVEGLGLDAAGVARRPAAASSSTTACARPIRTSTSSATSPAATSSRTSPSITPASCCGTRSSGCAGRSRRTVVPWCTYTDPELARVGLSEDRGEAAAASRTRSTASPFDEIDRARAEGETEGFAKIVTDPKGKHPRRRDRRAARGRADRRVRARR